MRARGYAWTNRVDVNKYEADQRGPRNIVAAAETVQVRAEPGSRQALRVVPGQAGAAAAGISKERYAAAQARCRANSRGDESLCNELDAIDVIGSEVTAGEPR